MNDENIPRTAAMREVLLKLEVNQHVRSEMHVAKEDLREYLRTDSARTRAEIKAEHNRLFAILTLVVTGLIGGDIWAVISMKDRVQAALNDEVTSIRASVKQRLDEEFRTPRITALVEEKAREYTAREAQHYISEQVESGLRPYQERVNTAFRELQTQKDELERFQLAAKNAADNLNRQQSASALFGGALSGSRKDFEELERLGRQNPVIADPIRKSLNAIKNSLEQYRKPIFVSGGIEITMPDQSGQERNLRAFSTTQLLNALQSESEGPEMMRYIMGYLVSRPRPELIAPALDVLKTSRYLPGVAATTGVLLSAFGDKAAFLDSTGWSRFLIQELAKSNAGAGAPTKR